MPPAIPTATYRAQLTAAFDFDRTGAIVPFLKELGISHLYASPFLKARKGSTHGYDIVDHAALNPELGGEAGFARMSHALRQHDIGLILDFVPNHVGIHFADNAWWLDVLEWGQASPHAIAFDIDWEMLPHRARGGVLLPILGSAYGEALENGDIVLKYDPAEGSFSAWYFEHRLPIAPQRYDDMLRVIVREADAAERPAGRALLALASRYEGLRRPDRTEATTLKSELRGIDGGEAVITRGLEAYRAGKDRPAQTKALHNLLERQCYRLGHWRLATSEINYRRFFDVNTLAGLRVEDAGVFEAMHSLVRKLIANGDLQGLRLDHIDGLRDPAQYFQRLRKLVREAQPDSSQLFYTVVEKILGEEEDLPKFAGVHGTTGYEWLNVISRVLVDGRGLEPLAETWRQISNRPPDFAPVVLEAKRRVLETLLLSEFTVLARLLARIASGHYATRDFSADSLRQALELYVLHFPVYRSYLTSGEPSPRDRDLIAGTIDKARANWFGADEGLFDFLRDALTMDLIRSSQTTQSAPRVRRFALKVQQFTGPTMAKALEDTAFYRDHRLLPLNEVGGDPVAGALTADAFHAAMQARAKQWPHGMTATATHDTKRGEDARARLLALAEMPGEWASLVARWKLLNAPHLVGGADARAPSATFEYMLYQAIAGAWPLENDPSFPERMQAYALKAAREGKQETSWLNPTAAYEDGIRKFLDRILDRKMSGEFLESMQSWVDRLAVIGALTSISQLTLKAMMPGVPDFYQGTEFWDFSLVDPDNRRPVDFAARADALHNSASPDWSALTTDWRNGKVKLAWTHHLLRLRRDQPPLFSEGSYEPLEVTGRDRDHVIAFARRHEGSAVIAVVGRWFAPLTNGGREWLRPGRIEAEVIAPRYALDVNAPAKSLHTADLLGPLPAAALFAKVVERAPRRRSKTRA